MAWRHGDALVMTSWLTGEDYLYSLTNKSYSVTKWKTQRGSVQNYTSGSQSYDAWRLRVVGGSHLWSRLINCYFHTAGCVCLHFLSILNWIQHQFWIDSFSCRSQTWGEVKNSDVAEIFFDSRLIWLKQPRFLTHLLVATFSQTRVRMPGHVPV